MYKYGGRDGREDVSYSTCALLHEAACVNFTHAMEFFFSDRERDAWRRSASREAWFIDWHRTDQYRTPCIFNEAGSSCRWRAPRTLPIANAARYEVSCQSTTRRGKSIVEDAIPSSSLAILYTFSPTDRVLMEEGRIQSEYDNEKRRVVDCNGQL